MLFSTMMQLASTVDAACLCMQHSLPDATTADLSRCRKASAAAPTHFLPCRAEPYLVPDSGYISMDHAHPSETAMSQFLGFYEDNNSMTNGSWRAGAHALYLTWLGGKSARVQRQREGENQSQSGDRGGLFSCCFGGGGGRQTSSAATQAGWEGVLRDKAAGFVEFRNLPHSSSHPYWQQFTLRWGAV